jgi:hypothetical protein
MAATILVKDALARVSGLLNDLSPQYARWSEAELVRWLNDAQAAVAKYLPSASTRIDTIKLQPGTRQSIAVIAAADCKPGDGSTPQAPIHGIQLLGVVRNMGDDGVTPGRAIRFTDRDVIDAVNPLWHTKSDATVRSASFKPTSPKTFYVSPGVAGEVWAEVEYLAMPLLIPAGGAPGLEIYAVGGTNNSTEKLTIDDENIDEVVYYTVARAHMTDAKWADRGVAQAYTGMFTASINARVAVLTGTNPNLTRLPFAPQPVGAAQ